MQPKHIALQRQIASLAKWFSELAGRLAQVATDLEGARTLPPEALVRELDEARREFSALCAGVLDAARAFSLPEAQTATITSLSQLEQLMMAVSEAADAEEKRAMLAEAREAAFAVFDRILRMTHLDDPKFPALIACQAKARDIGRAIADSTSLDVDVQRTAWADAVRPFSDLLTMVEGRESVNDDSWIVLEDNVAKAFGRPLAVAATRSRLLIRKI